MSLNFGSNLSKPAVSTAKPRLKPWNIYDVTFEGCKVETFVGKKDPSKSYDVLKIRFENESGYYEHSIFFPTEEDAKRPVYTNKDGHEYEGPSSFEQTMAIIAQLGTVINPDGFKKMQEMSSKFKSFNDVCTVLVKITDPKKGTPTKLKLIGKTKQDGSVEATLPRIIAVNKQGETFPSDNFVGNVLTFSEYEEKRKREYESAKPTEMPSAITSEVPDVDDTPAGLDLNSLLD